MKSFKLLLLSVITLSLVSACGNIASRPDQFGNIPGDGTQLTASSTSLSASEHCSQSPNILGSDGSFSNEYRACSTGSTVGNMMLTPSDDSHSRAVCVFPVRVSGNGQASAVISNPSSPINTRYVYQCLNLPATGGRVNFRGLNFNAVYVVNSAQAAILSQCISYGDVTGCAEANGLTLSFGQM